MSDHARLGPKPPALPSRAWQVPLAWRYMFAPSTYLYFYGIGLGLGFLTRVRTASLYVCVLFVLVSAEPLAALLAAMAYAGSRAFPVAALAREKRAQSAAERPVGREPVWAMRVDGAVLAAAGVVMLLSEGLVW